MAKKRKTRGPQRRKQSPGSVPFVPGPEIKARPPTKRRRARRVSSAKIEAEMKASLEASAARFEDLDKRAVGKVRVYRNADGSVSGEIKIPLHSRLSAKRVLLDMGDAVKGVRRAGVWEQVGFTFEPTAKTRTREEWQKYNRSRGGMGRLGTYYRRRDKLGNSILTARDLVDKVQRRKRGTVNQVYVRLHWDPEGNRPSKRRK